MIKPLSTYSAALNIHAPQPQRQGVAGIPATSAESVRISDAARHRLSLESTGLGDSTFSQLLSRSAHEDPIQAEKLARELSQSKNVPWLDFSEQMKGTGPIKYAASGLPVTADSEAYFNSMSSAVFQNGIEVYNTEKAKGTAAADIVDKLIGYMDALPTKYKEMINWTRRVTG